MTLCKWVTQTISPRSCMYTQVRTGSESTFKSLAINVYILWPFQAPPSPSVVPRGHRGVAGGGRLKSNDPHRGATAERPSQHRGNHDQDLEDEDDEPRAPSSMKPLGEGFNDGEVRHPGRSLLILLEISSDRNRSGQSASLCITW